MNRYLINLSYIGTKFRGMQKTIKKIEATPTDVLSIQGLLEIALRKLQPVNQVEVVLSSRTDAGVHALHNSVHIDLENAYGGVYPTGAITSLLNRHFAKEALPIRALNTVHVPRTFHCRYNAKGRTYLYRLAVAKNSVNTEIVQGLNKHYVLFIPIEEYERCLFLQNTQFDIEAFKDAAQLFVGRHDFRTFMNASKRNQNQKRPSFGVRIIDSLTVESGRSCSTDSNRSKAELLYDYWNVTITGKSFLHNQIRRIVGSLICVATGKITKKDVYEMLTIPSKFTWNPKTTVAAPYGLYLCKVHYDENEMKFESEDLEPQEIIKAI